ncbi:uncharacterized protein LOC143166054 [Aptenodytes patagonicus]|uniref:uncharacterized protein LOC143166054 n=1 Tax=Aptenodytes patagonicus TaxID=9234 RepID=UPI003FA04227
MSTVPCAGEDADLHSRARWVSPTDLYHLLAAWTVTGLGMKCEGRKLAVRSPSVGRCCVCSAPAPARHPARLASKSLGLFASPYLAVLVRGNYSFLARRVLVGELQASVVDSHVEVEPCVLCCAPREEAACGKASSKPCISHFVMLQAVAQEEAVESLPVPVRSDTSSWFLLQAGQCVSA